MILNLILNIVMLGLVVWLVGLLPLPSPFQQVILVLAVICIIVWIVGAFTSHAYLPMLKVF